MSRNKIPHCRNPGAKGSLEVFRVFRTERCEGKHMKRTRTRSSKYSRKMDRDERSLNRNRENSVGRDNSRVGLCGGMLEGAWR